MGPDAPPPLEDTLEYEAGGVPGAGGMDAAVAVAAPAMGLGLVGSVSGEVAGAGAVGYGEETARRAGRVRVKAGGAQGFGSRPDAWRARTCGWHAPTGCHSQPCANVGYELAVEQGPHLQLTGRTITHAPMLPLKGHEVQVDTAQHAPMARQLGRRVAVSRRYPTFTYPRQLLSAVASAVVTVAATQLQLWHWWGRHS